MCQSYVVRNPADESSTYHSLPVGTVLVLQRAVVILPTRARVYFQKGQAGSAISEFEPHCELEVKQVLPVPQTVHPDEFVINRVAYEIMNVVAVEGLQYAHRGGAGGVSDIMKAWKMRLHSDKQPEVLQFICAGALNSPFLARTPSVKQIRAALGDYAVLRLP